MSITTPLDQSGLLVLSGFLLYSTQEPRFNGTSSLLPVWYLVGLHYEALPDLTNYWHAVS